MAKKIYGKGASPKTKKQSSCGDGSVWVTLIANAPEEKLHMLIITALIDPLAPPAIDASSHVALAASLIEYAAEKTADCDEAWIALLQELFLDFSISLADPDDAVSDSEFDAAAAERSGAEALLGCLKRHGVLCAEPPPPPALTVGDAVLAVLEEDGEWHEAAVVELKPGGAGGPPRIIVQFAEWPKRQACARTAVVSLASVPDDDEEGDGGGGGTRNEGECELCTRVLELTFHHLIPKETHGRYLNRSLPRGVAEAAVESGLAERLEPQPTREFLNSHGAMLCRFCHSTVHRHAPNAVLAERFNTTAKLREPAEIMRFVAFCCKQKATARGAR